MQPVTCMETYHTFQAASADSECFRWGEIGRPSVHLPGSSGKDSRPRPVHGGPAGRHHRLRRGHAAVVCQGVAWRQHQTVQGTKREIFI